MGWIDLDCVIDFSYFPEIHFDMKTSIKLTTSLPLPDRSEVPKEILRHSNEPFSIELEKTIQGSMKTTREPTKQPNEAQELAPTEVTISPPIPTICLPEKETLQTPKLLTHSDLVD